jgi:hypothetical protein
MISASCCVGAPMADKPILYLTHEACLGHDMGEGHPECPDRLRAIWQALEAPEFAALHREAAPAATEAQLARAHPPAYVSAILDIRPEEGERARLDADTIMSHGSAEAALRAAGAGIRAGEAVLRGEARAAFCAVRPPGHHAEPEQPMGFCVGHEWLALRCAVHAASTSSQASSRPSASASLAATSRQRVATAESSSSPRIISATAGPRKRFGGRLFPTPSRSTRAALSH